MPVFALNKRVIVIPEGWVYDPFHRHVPGYTFVLRTPIPPTPPQIGSAVFGAWPFTEWLLSGKVSTRMCGWDSEKVVILPFMFWNITPPLFFFLKWIKYRVSFFIFTYLFSHHRALFNVFDPRGPRGPPTPYPCKNFVATPYTYYWTG